MELGWSQRGLEWSGGVGAPRERSPQEMLDLCLALRQAGKGHLRPPPACDVCVVGGDRKEIFRELRFSEASYRVAGVRQWSNTRNLEVLGAK